MGSVGGVWVVGGESGALVVAGCIRVVGGLFVPGCIPVVGGPVGMECTHATGGTSGGWKVTLARELVASNHQS